jgi:hypothetical protein
MIDLLGGFRFRHMELMEVKGMQLLLDACAETLETLSFDPGFLQREGFSPKALQLIIRISQSDPLTYHGTNRFGRSRSQSITL